MTQVGGLDRGCLGRTPRCPSALRPEPSASTLRQVIPRTDRSGGRGRLRASLLSFSPSALRRIDPSPSENHALSREWCPDIFCCPRTRLGPGIPDPPAGLPAPPIIGHRPPSHFRVVARPVLGCLHHEHRLRRWRREDGDRFCAPLALQGVVAGRHRGPCSMRNGVVAFSNLQSMNARRDGRVCDSQDDPRREKDSIVSGGLDQRSRQR
jgi:hypothetical protein